MPIDFPNSPANGDSYSVDGKTWQFDGSVWSSVQGSSTIGNSSVATEHLAADSVTGNKIANLAVSNAGLAANSVNQGKCASNISLITITTSLNRSTDVPNPFLGQLVYETDTVKVRAWTGSAWSPITIS